MVIQAEKDTTGKIILASLAGADVGAVVGVLLAPGPTK